MQKLSFFLGFLFLFLSSCSSKPEPINYGTDNCGLCKMTIIEKEYACELVTTKGKILKFDDVNCMIKYLKTSQTTDKDYAFMMVNDFENPKNFIDVRKLNFVSGEAYKSPMRGDLAAFSNLRNIEKAKQKDPNIKVFSWKELLEKF